ncbi:unnamed protein product [Hydatigera taeniaeformis]|uniref:Uncharacterized protein n=1 Tax=Hydatigena taeniaeformis TaxID=6205 RepID=A0A0R3XC42_HYDTA|nr:unnamed protein product [Hydatigera taeniaeformis]
MATSIAASEQATTLTSVSIASPSQPQTTEPTSTGMNMANHRTPSRRLSLALPTTDLCSHQSSPIKPFRRPISTQRDIVA